MNVLATIGSRIGSARVRRVLAGFIAVFTTAAAMADSEWCTRVWQTDDGLLNNSVTSVVQTRDGFLWVGTTAGLLRFDGVNFIEVPYLPAGTNSNPYVRNLLPSRAGGLWIVPESGPVVCLNSDFSRVSLPADEFPKGYIVGLAEGESGIWVSDFNGSIFRIKDGKMKQYGAKDGVPAGIVNSFVVDNNENVWLAKGGIITVLRDDKFVEMATFKGKKVHVIPARTNGVWIAVGLQVFKCDTNGQQQLFGTIQPAVPTAIARTLIEDHNGQLWVGMDAGGLFHYNGSAFEPVEVSHPFVSCLTEDSEGDVWAGTLGGGLDRVFPGAVRLEAMQNGRSLVAIRSVCEDAEGMMWGVTQDDTLVCRSNSEWITPPIPVSNIVDGVNCVLQHQGSLWIAAHGKLCRWRDNMLKSWDSRGLASSFSELLSASNGDIWVCALGHNSAPVLLRFRGNQMLPLNVPLSAGRRLAAEEDAQGKIWIGGSAGKLYRLEGNTNFVDVTALTSLSGWAIQTLYATPDGSLWIGYAGAGLGRIKNGNFEHITKEQALPENYITQIIADDDGWLWFGGDRGIFKVRQSDVESVMDHHAARVSPIVYGKNEGVFSQQTDATISHAAFRSRAGQIWMPMRSELAVINPNIQRDQPKPPTVYLTRVTVDDQPIASYGSLASAQEMPNLKTLTVPLHLDPQHRKLQFEFSALNFAAPENVHFRYRLEGYDDNWVDGGTLRNTHYSRLPAGHYQFHVAACNSDGVWSEARVPLSIIVAPFFWQTNWFRLVTLLVFSSVLIAVARYVFNRRFHAKLRAMEQQAALDRSRMAGMADVAASVLHNVGNVLNSVNVSSTIVRDKVQQTKTGSLQKVIALLDEHSNDLPAFIANDPRGKQLPDYLSTLLHTMSSEQEETLREIASLDENIEHIKEIVASQQRYAQGEGVIETFEPATVADDALRIHAGALDANHIEVIRDFQEMPSVSTDKHKVLQILVTLIGNAQQALEAAEKNEKRIVVRVGKNGGDHLKISVIDNGIGIPQEKLTRIFLQSFSSAKSGRHIGLHSSANAARHLGGTLVAHSDGPGTGATFTLEFPLDHKKNGKPAAHHAEVVQE